MILIGLTSTAKNTQQNDQLEWYLNRLAAGGKDALQPLYADTKAAVYGFVLSILKHRSDAEDVMQETYLQIYSGAGRYRPQGKPMAWIITIARNLAMMRLREKNRTHEPLEDWTAVSLSPEVTTEDRLMLSLAMQALTSDESQIVMLHAVSGLKHREIASVLELPLPTVLSKYHRALKKLKLRLAEEEPQ